MAGTVYTLAPNPHWVIIDNFSKLPAGAAIYTYSSLNPSQFKAAFKDAAGSNAYGQPIVGFGNGTMPPIFWEFDPANPTDTYYIRVYSAPIEDNGQFLWDFNGISGNNGSGGGTVVTANNIKNFVVNGEFYRNVGNQAGTPSLPTSITLAPSNNAGFVNDPTNANGPTGPDIIFAKNNTSASDSLSFVNFTPLGIQALTSDVTPSQYLEYVCSVGGSSETYKYVQFPIAQGIQSLSQQQMVMGLWAKGSGASTQIILKCRMFFGTGGAPSADRFVTIDTITLPTNWTGIEVPFITPDATTGGTLGDCGNDAIFLQIWMPLDSTCTIDFVKPSLYFGTAAPALDYETNDQINSISDTARTGDIRYSLNSFMPYGWVAMNDGVISNAGVFVLPAGVPSARANIDTFPLFDLIWRTFQANQSLSPMYDNVGNPVAYGATPAADFTAPRQLQLTKAAGRVIAAVSGSHAIGTIVGADNYTLAANDLPVHTHIATGGQNFVITGGGVGQLAGGAGLQTSAQTGNNATTNNPISLLQPTVYVNVFIKL